MKVRYQTYPEYKDSSVDWLDKIPSHWNIWKLNHFAPVITCGVASTPEYVDDGVVFLSAQNIKNRKIDLSKGYRYISQESHEILTKNRIPRKGDILLSRVGTVGEVCIVDVDFEFSIFVSLTHLRIEQNTCINRYFVFLCQTTYTKALNAAVTLVGGGVGNLNVNDLREYRLPIPPVNEQQKIANFLDHETAKIDTLIEKQQQLIKLLKEKRQAVISHAVTKGLNPNAPMRDSGVEWLGEVPEHWEIKRINLLFSESSKRASDKEELDYPVLSVSIHHGISNKELNEEELDRKIQRSDDRSLYKIVKSNFLAYNMMRAWQGGFGASTVNGLVSPAYVVCQPKTILNSYYFELALRTENAVVELKRFSRGITDFRLRLYWDEFKNISVPVPPQEEIESILNSISTINSTYDNLEDVTRKQIALLKERRTALISAAVTGKIDVRNWQAPKP